jgi:Asp-tRNA(Asn)/Glu-tRNA(Gln) amidotransferase C subunit
MSSDTHAESIVRELAAIADAVKRLAAVAQQPVQPQSSVEISRNSKGATWSVKVYAEDAAGACELAEAIYDKLAATYGQQTEASA